MTGHVVADCNEFGSVKHVTLRSEGIAGGSAAGKFATPGDCCAKRVKGKINKNEKDKMV